MHVPAVNNLLDTAASIWFEHLSGVPSRAAMVAWGVTCLEAGIEAQPVALLAGADDLSPEEVAGLFRQGADSLGVVLPAKGSGDESYWMEAYICRRIQEGGMDERIALRHLYALWLESGMSERCQVWMYLADSIGLVEDGREGVGPFARLTPATVRDIIRAEALKVLAAGQPTNGGDMMPQGPL